MTLTRLDQLKNFLEQEPNDAFLKYAIATEYLSLGFKDKTLELFEALLVEHPDYLGTYYHLGKLYEQFAKTSEAEKTYSKGIELAKTLKNKHAQNELQQALDDLIGFED